MWLTLAFVLVGAEPTSADAAFKQMEQQVAKCKTLQTQLEISAGSGKDVAVSMKGRLLVAPGDKVRLELDGSIKGQADKMVMISNGTKQRMISSGRPAQDQDTKKQLGEVVLASLARGGIFFSLFTVAPEVADEKDTFHPAKALTITDLKFGKKEVVSGIEAQAIEYKITLKDAKVAMAATVWVDVKSYLPIKQVVDFKEGNNAITITEVYTKTAVDGKIDAKEFELPK